VGLDDGFQREDGRQTPKEARMFGGQTRNAAPVLTPNIAPSSGPIAPFFSFFINSFLAKPSRFTKPVAKHFSSFVS
jgi:hypothetical protein